MWVFTQVGFFSATLFDEMCPTDTRIQVRARVRADLEALVARYCAEPVEILQWPGRDYPYRIIITRQQWAEIVSQVVLEIDYGNFKDRVKAVQGGLRSAYYGDVWGVLYDLEAKLRNGVRHKFEAIFGEVGSEAEE